MVTVISGTNRPGSRTRIFAESYAELLRMKGVESVVFGLEEMSEGFSLSEMYTYKQPLVLNLVEKFISPASALVIMAPEYNGGVPGVLKLFIDSVSPSLFKNVHIALVGTSSGRSGNLRGLDNLTNMLHYLQSDVLPYKVPVSMIEKMVGENGLVYPDELTMAAFDRQADLLISKIKGN